jgi:hypothetical protein
LNEMLDWARPGEPARRWIADPASLPIHVCIGAWNLGVVDSIPLNEPSFKVGRP